MGPTTISAGPLSLPAPFDDMIIRVQDVGGLIDLNTASPELLAKLFETLEFPADAAARYRQWRREGQRLTRVDDLIRITGTDPAIGPDLLHVATVFSGRRGVSPDHTPSNVVSIITGSSGTIPDAFISPPSNSNFAVYEISSDGERRVGVISIFESSEQSRILEIR